MEVKIIALTNLLSAISKYKSLKFDFLLVSVTKMYLAKRLLSKKGLVLIVLLHDENLSYLKLAKKRLSFA